MGFSCLTVLHVKGWGRNIYLSEYEGTGYEAGGPSLHINILMIVWCTDVHMAIFYI